MERRLRRVQEVPPRYMVISRGKCLRAISSSGESPTGGSPPGAAGFGTYQDTRTGPRRASVLDSAIRLGPGSKGFESLFGWSVDGPRTGQYNSGPGPSERPSERASSTGPLPSHQIVSIFRRLVSIRQRIEHECSFVSVGRVERQAILRYSQGVLGYGQSFTPADMENFGQAP